MIRTAVAIAISLASPAPAFAQHRTIGVDPSASTVRTATTATGEYYWQSMRVPTDIEDFTFMRLRLWFEGSPLGNDLFYTQLYFGAGDPYNDLFSLGYLDQNTNGYATFTILNQGYAPGELLWLRWDSGYVWNERCWDFNTGAFLPENEGCIVADENAYLRLTLTDQYDGGDFYSGDVDPSNTFNGRDIFFQAEFVVTPEPATMLLLASGLGAVGVAIGRRRRNSRPV